MPLYDKHGRMIPSPAPKTNAAGAIEIDYAATAPKPAAPAPSGATAPPPAQRTAIAAGQPMPRADLDRQLAHMLATGDGVSDLFFVAGRPPQVETFGELAEVEGGCISGTLIPAQTEAIALALIAGTPRLLADLEESGSCDTAYAVEGLARFRVNVFKQRGTYAMVLRKLSTKIASLDDLSLPPIFRRIVTEKTGLIFVTGATGSGKTTTLAAMLNEVNQTHKCHIVTLEDPIEYVHPHLAGTFSQREMGHDFSDFATGLRAALRQAPKVILVGEIRDRETMEIALTAAETGHVVYSTLHTISAGQSIQRVLGMFEKDEEKQMRARLSEVLRWVVSQRLAPKIGGGRKMIAEIMGSNLRTREAIQLGESDVRNLHEIIEASRQDGWCSFEQSLGEAFETGIITEETAMLLSVNKSRMRRALDVVLKRTGQDKTTTDGLRLTHFDEPEPVAKPPPLPLDVLAPGLKLKSKPAGAAS
ncbi:MAG: PilT/PilU family type 4a pilus ATPase [Chthoniobacteraceae bacterium]